MAFRRPGKGSEIKFFIVIKNKQRTGTPHCKGEVGQNLNMFYKVGVKAL